MGKLSAHDVLDGMMVLIALVGFLYGILQNRAMRVRENERKQEMRGVRGFKFRLMYRALAQEHPDWPVNGEDED